MADECLVVAAEEATSGAVVFRGAAKLVISGHLQRASSLLSTLDDQRLRDHYRAVLLEGGRRSMTAAPRRPLPKLSRSPRPPRSPDQERALFARDGWRCRWCTTLVIDEGSLRRMAEAVSTAFRYSRRNSANCHGLGLVAAAEVSYMVPHEHGGSADPDNLVTACRACGTGLNGSYFPDLDLADPRERPAVTDDWDGCAWFAT